jgi:hypothetical protein
LRQSSLNIREYLVISQRDSASTSATSLPFGHRCSRSDCPRPGAQEDTLIVCIDRHSTRQLQRETLVRTLILIEKIQPQVTMAVLHKLPELSVDSDSTMPDEQGHIGIPRLILQQLQWLDVLVDSKVYRSFTTILVAMRHRALLRPFWRCFTSPAQIYSAK